MTFTASLAVGDRRYRCVDLHAASGGRLGEMPLIHRILLENVVRCGGGDAELARASLVAWLDTTSSTEEIPFLPGRILMHDTTCGPALVDIAAMRSALAEAGGDPAALKPRIAVDVSTDHSIAVDVFARPDALQQNMAREMERNAERYRLMKWASSALGIRVHPPGTGIMHTLNLERLATVVATAEADGVTWAMPDTLIGTDSHTPMINGIGVLGWGVGGIEAEGVMFGLPTMLRVPDVVGVRLVGALREGVLATDLALTVTERLRRVDLADKFVEFFGPGIAALSAGDRAVVANMAPEFGGNSGYFPIDTNTLAYLRATGRTPEHVRLVEAYARRNGFWHELDAAPCYSDTIEIDLSAVSVSLAGPRRPQDRIAAGTTRAALGLDATTTTRSGLPRAPVAIASITSCTNTSDPRLLIAAGLLARKARALGMSPRPWVKTSLAPGSPTAARYLARSGLLDDLEALGFGIVGYGCTTCIGNSGALTTQIADALGSGRDVTPVAVLSGNRNFPGRVHPDLDAGFLASPPMVVAFALAGDADRDILTDPIAKAVDGREVRLADLWPSGAAIDAAMAAALDHRDIARAYDEAEASVAWDALTAPSTALWPWDAVSTYIRRPPFANASEPSRLGIYTARPLLVLGDDMTTDHISPAGQIPARSETARHLVANGEDAGNLNVYASRRGNWQVMLRGLFTNKAAVNRLGDGIATGMTAHRPSGDIAPIWQVAARYTAEGQSTVIMAGERYGMGSSRDWAAKGVALLGVRAVIAQSFERIHRSNLIGMGVLPLRLPAGVDLSAIGIQPDTQITVDAPPSQIMPRSRVALVVRTPGASPIEIEAIAAIETAFEVELLRRGGMFQVLIGEALGS
jgi:aconitate hydratase